MEKREDKKFRLVLDPRTIFVLMIISVIIFFQNIDKIYFASVMVLGWILLILEGHIRTALKFFVFIGSFILITFLVSKGPTTLILIWSIITISLQFILPFVSYMLLLIKSCSVNDIAIVLDKLRAPHFVSIPILVMIRFIPTIHEEYSSIRNAMVFRGIEIGFKNAIRHPIKMLEYIYVPLLFSLVRIGEELTMSSLTRGLGLYKDRTRMKDMNLKLWDYLVLLIYIAILIIAMYNSYKIRG